MQIRPYGDTANDGVVQISFTLPLPLGGRAREAARRYAMLMGISNPLVAHAEAIDKAFTFFVVYGACSHTLDPDQIPVDELAHEEMDFHEILGALKEIGYAGGVHVELSRHSHDAVETARRALAYLRAL